MPRMNLMRTQPMVVSLPVASVHGVAKVALREALAQLMLPHSILDAIQDAAVEFSPEAWWPERDETVR